MKGSKLLGILIVLTLLIAALPAMSIGVDASAPVTLFQAVHCGQQGGNWNVGLWVYYGDGTQLPAYGGGAVNHAGSGAVRWDDGSQGTDHGLTHSFVLTYDPTSRALSFQVTGGSKTDLLTTTSPVVPPAAPGPVNNLNMQIKATAGTSVSCANQGGSYTQAVNSSKTTVSNLALDGAPLTGIEVEAKLSDNPTSPSFTNMAELNIPVPTGVAWTLTGKIAVSFVAANMAFPPKQNRIGMTALNGQYVAPIDLDGDGYTVSQGDCDDNDNTIYPSAPEICDGKDNDCDGSVDEGTTLFQAVHQGQNQGNWNVGLWKYNGDGTQDGYVNHGGSGAVRWDDGSQGTDNGLTHDFTLSYDPTTYALSFQVTGGSKTVLETTTSPVVPPAAPGPVNNLHMVIRATAGTLVQCANQNSMPKQQVDSSKTTVSDLALNGAPLAGIEVEAKLVDNPSSESFTNQAELDIPVPTGAAWTLTGKIAVSFVAANMAAPPKQNRIGMTQLNGQYVCTPMDADADGYTVSQGDCDDNDNTIYPGAPELADGKDNDCDGSIDEGIGPPGPAGPVDWWILMVQSSEGGTVTEPTGGNFPYGAGDFFSYYPDTVVDLVAVPDAGYRFVGWTGAPDIIADTSAAITTITMSRDCLINANFAEIPETPQIPQYELTISSTAGGSVNVPGEGTFPYDAGRVLDLVAEADSGYRFVNWTGDVTAIASVNGASTSLTMNDDYSIVANFVEIRDQFTLTISSSSGGSVTTPGEATFAYDEGTVVNLQAEPEEGYRFVIWMGDVEEIADVTAASTTITMNDDYSVTATFKFGTGCFIATAAYGTPMAEEIGILREFRDEYLLTSRVGETLVDTYYTVSPPIAGFITEHPGLKPIVRAGLAPAVAMSTVAVNTSPAGKAAILGLLVLSGALAVWTARRRHKGSQYA